MPGYFLETGTKKDPNSDNNVTYGKCNQCTDILSICKDNKSKSILC